VRLTDWLRQREPEPPPVLARRIAEFAAPFDAQERDAADGCLAAATSALGRVLGAQAGSRDSAVDLLAVDALVTYAFEAAAASPDRIPPLGREAMLGLSSLGAAP
jgi:hypothetical protein